MAKTSLSAGKAQNTFCCFISSLVICWVKHVGNSKTSQTWMWLGTSIFPPWLQTIILLFHKQRFRWDINPGTWLWCFVLLVEAKDPSMFLINSPWDIPGKRNKLQMSDLHDYPMGSQQTPPAEVLVVRLPEPNLRMTIKQNSLYYMIIFYVQRKTIKQNRGKAKLLMQCPCRFWQ